MYEDSDQSIHAFAWPQTTLTCVNRRNPLHESSSNVLSQIGGVTLRYSHESQSYVIDGRMKIGEDTKSKARNTIRSHYRWIRQDISDADTGRNTNTSAQPTQQSPREINAKWNHTRIKKLRKFAAVKKRRMQTIMPTPNLPIKQNASLTSSLQEDSSNEPTATMEYGKEKKTRTCLGIDNAISTNEPKEEQIPEEPIPMPISTSSSNDSYSDESSTSCIPPPPPPPPPPQESQQQIQQSFSNESSLTDNSPTCVTANISHYKRPDDKGQQIDKKGIIKKNKRKKGRVTWWDDKSNRHKPFLLKTDVPMVDDSRSFDLMGRCRMGIPTYDSIDTSLHACTAPKYFTGKFWADKHEKIKTRGCKVRKNLDDAIDKVKIMAIDLSESVSEVSCGIDKKEIPEHTNASSGILKGDAKVVKRDERSVHREVMDVPITEVIIPVESWQKPKKIKGPARGLSTSHSM